MNALNSVSSFSLALETGTVFLVWAHQREMAPAYSGMVGSESVLFFIVAWGGGYMCFRYEQGAP